MGKNHQKMELIKWGSGESRTFFIFGDLKIRDHYPNLPRKSGCYDDDQPEVPCFQIHGKKISTKMR